MTEIIKFKNFVLDRFQIEAIHSIEKNHSVVVSAATGTGKTLIADYVIDKYLKEKKHIIYTAPIKALSNQKYRDFKEQYGEENVGILTGDITINPGAPLKIMTTEIYRNMLLSKDPDVEDLAYVIFDEIHYLGDYERGTVWEESIIFSNPHIRFICLSATIPNARQFANWVNHIKKHKVDVVTEKKRAVPLKHMFYDNEKGFLTLKEIFEFKELDKYPKYHKAFKNKKRFFEEKRKAKKLGTLDILRDIEREKNLPCIYFCFSRVLTEKKGEKLMRKKNYLTSEEALEARKIVKDKLATTDQSVLGLKTTRLLRQCLSNGIGFHHAGILPVLKEIVEKLFEKGLVKVLFATETFAVGINMPAKTVIFDSLEKFDGINFRYLLSREYFQLAGRAGRRGIDKIGYCVAIIDREFADLEKIKKITEADTDLLTSQFKLSYNTILNLIHSHTSQEREIILQSSFYSYQQEGRTKARRILASFKKREKQLIKYGYIQEGDMGKELTMKGLFGMKIYIDELTVSEIFCSEVTKTLTPLEILLIVGGIVFEDKKNLKFKGRGQSVSRRLYKRLFENQALKKYFSDKPFHFLEPFISDWYNGCEFVDLLELTNMPEGDIVRYIRQMLDLLQQIEHATLDDELRNKVYEIKKKIDRDVIAVKF